MNTIGPDFGGCCNQNHLSIQGLMKTKRTVRNDPGWVWGFGFKFGVWSLGFRIWGVGLGDLGQSDYA